MHWKRDAAIRERMTLVQRLHFSGATNAAIAAQLAIAEATVRLDLERLRQQWIERNSAEAEVLRSAAALELDEVKALALAQAAWDQQLEAAVLLGAPVTVRCPGGIVHQPPLDAPPAVLPVRCEEPHDHEVYVVRDEKGSAQFRSAKAQSLNVARQAIMDKAKVLGVAVDKSEVKHDATRDYLAWLERFERGGSNTPPAS